MTQKKTIHMKTNKLQMVYLNFLLNGTCLS